LGELVSGVRSLIGRGNTRKLSEYVSVLGESELRFSSISGVVAMNSQ